MEWNALKLRVHASLEGSLRRVGFRAIRSRTAFERSWSHERRIVQLRFISTRHGRRSLSVWCGASNKDLDYWFHRTSQLEPRLQRGYYALSLALPATLPLDGEEQVGETVGAVAVFLTEAVIPFLELDLSLLEYSNILNQHPLQACPYQGNVANRCAYGLVAAKLAHDKRYTAVRGAYEQRLRKSCRGFYWARLERLIADLEANAP